jgi:hypothetical protein
MRGDYKAAKELSLSILKRFPNNATAHTLLGDICAEEGDLEHAAEWYELAVDLNRDSVADKRKFDAVRQRIKDRNAAASAQQLEIPQKRPTNAYVWVAAGAIVVVGVIGYLLGERGDQPDLPRVVDQPIDVGRNSTQTSQTSPPPEQAEPAQEQGTEPSAATDLVRDDATLVGALRTLPDDGSRIISAIGDQRSNSVLITARLHPDEDPKQVIGRLGASALSLQGWENVRAVTIRLVREGDVVAMGDVTAENVRSALTALPPEAQGKLQPEGYELLVTNQWFAQQR